MRAVMIGGGVGGCALAAALRGLPVGSRPLIVERRTAGAPAGMGFILMPNGLAALEMIAPEFDWHAAGQRIDRVVLRTASGRVLSDQAIEPGVCVARARFLAMLRDAAGGAEFVDGAAFAGFERGDGGCVTTAVLEDGRRIAGDCFFGCDGAQSRTRALLFPEARLGETVVKEIVSVAYAPALARQLGTAFHKFHDEEGGLAVGLLAEGPERVVWFVQYDARRWPGVASHARSGTEALAASLAEFVAERTRGWSHEVAAACAETDFTRSHLWPTRDLHPLASLSDGTVALVGDAAHACLPFTSQGANGALVDAAVPRKLLAEVRDARGAAAGFALYSALRRPHHRRMFMEGRRLREAFLAPLSTCAPAVPLVS